MPRPYYLGSQLLMDFVKNLDSKSKSRCLKIILITEIYKYTYIQVHAIEIYIN